MTTTAERSRRPGPPSTRTLRRAVLLLLLGVTIAVATTRIDRTGGALQPAAPTPTFDGTDTAWIQLMIPMDEQIIVVLDLAAERTLDKQVLALVERVGATRRDELTDLRRLRDRAGLPATNVHEGHDMPGMVTPEELAMVAAQRDTTFNTALRAALREHLDQGVRLAAAERAHGADPETRQLAARIEEVRSTELGWLAGPPVTGSDASTRSTG